MSAEPIQSPINTNFSFLEQQDWQDYELLDSGDGEKLERFGQYTLVRPDPQILWSKQLPESAWQRADAVFKRTHEDKGEWKTKTRLPEEWPMHWQDMQCLAKLSPFKHTGVFPEQSAHWAWTRHCLETAIKENPQHQPHVLNLFAYTGMASLVCAKAGAKITHVDASRSAIGWAKKNQAASGLDEKSVRWILDDVLMFVRREAKRGNLYDGIIMDPPVYGHGPQGERWKFSESLPELLDVCQEILSDQPLFMIINAYAVSTSAVTLANLLSERIGQRGGVVDMGELGLRTSNSDRTLSTGIWARWSKNS